MCGHKTYEDMSKEEYYANNHQQRLKDIEFLRLEIKQLAESQKIPVTVERDDPNEPTKIIVSIFKYPSCAQPLEPGIKLIAKTAGIKVEVTPIETDEAGRATKIIVSFPSVCPKALE